LFAFHRLEVGALCRMSSNTGRSGSSGGGGGVVLVPCCSFKLNVP
jgi:hypothetical protein